MESFVNDFPESGKISVSSSLLEEIPWTLRSRLVGGFSAPNGISVSEYVSDGPSFLSALSFSSTKWGVQANIYNLSNSVLPVSSNSFGEPREIYLPPSCGFGFYIPPFEELGRDPDDPLFSVDKWESRDVGWTATTGSPRNGFFSYVQYLAAKDPGFSFYRNLDRYVSWQLLRPYQLPVGFSSTTNVSWYSEQASISKIEDFPSSVKIPGVGTILPFDSHHFTIRILADAALAGNVRALDQIRRILKAAFMTTRYYNDLQYAAEVKYGGIPRVPGWWLAALADASEVALKWSYAPQSFLDKFGIPVFIVENARNHLEILKSIEISSFTAPPDARHLLVPHVLPWQLSVLAFGLIRCRQVGLFSDEESSELISEILDWLESNAWNGDSQSPVFYDSVDPKGKVSPRPMDTLSFWLAPPFFLSRPDSPILEAVIKFAENKVGGSDNLLSRVANESFFYSKFAPLLDQ